MPAGLQRVHSTCKRQHNIASNDAAMSCGCAGAETIGWLLTFRDRARRARRFGAQPLVMRCISTPSASSSVIK